MKNEFTYTATVRAEQRLSADTTQDTDLWRLCREFCHSGETPSLSDCMDMYDWFVVYLDEDHPFGERWEIMNDTTFRETFTAVDELDQTG